LERKSLQRHRTDNEATVINIDFSRRAICCHSLGQRMKRLAGDIFLKVLFDIYNEKFPSNRPWYTTAREKNPELKDTYSRQGRRDGRRSPFSLHHLT
jgi:hypothetical protein